MRIEKDVADWIANPANGAALEQIVEQAIRQGWLELQARERAEKAARCFAWGERERAEKAAQGHPNNSLSAHRRAAHEATLRAEDAERKAQELNAIIDDKGSGRGLGNGGAGDERSVERSVEQAGVCP